MSAIISPECGHAAHLMEVDKFEGSPQLHLHFLTEQYEHELIGYFKVEFCCHGCGTSKLIYYMESEDGASPRHMELKSNFEKKHKNCPNRNYEHLCPNYRSSCEVIDMRPVRRRKKTSAYPTHPVRTGPVSHPGQGLAGNGRPSVRKEASKG